MATCNQRVKVLELATCMIKAPLVLSNLRLVPIVFHGVTSL
jgi:hypothetical protein